MISDFLYSFKDFHVFFNLFNYISFRAGLSLVFSFTIIILLMPSWINIQLKLFPKGQPIRNDGPKTHLSKEGTPTFGGVLIIFSIILNTIFWSSDFSKFNYILLFTLIVFGLIGFYDDYQKVKFSRGISTKRKFLFQILCTVLLYFIISYNGYDLNNFYIPFLKDISIELGLFYFFSHTFYYYWIN